eukprot:TRINITY_DN36949_c0_g1_i1.p1 TRINITY_DN36949_c0_g1~~TRINITY_DN36949_c0_g1_i1.p1  ORF type:complete len:174 (+),score=52.87 TRINITY_DN36949_c0_g1_i1:66-587(+)
MAAAVMWSTPQLHAQHPAFGEGARLRQLADRAQELARADMMIRRQWMRLAGEAAATFRALAQPAAAATPPSAPVREGGGEQHALRNVLPPYRAQFAASRRAPDCSRAQHRDRGIAVLTARLRSVGGAEDIQQLSAAVDWNADHRPFLGSLYTFVKKNSAQFIYGKRSVVMLKE